MRFSARKVISSVLVAALTVSMSVVGTGCSNNNKNGGVSKNAASNGGTAASSQLPKGKTLRVWTYMEAEAPTLKEYAEKWAKKTGNTVNLIYQKSSMQQFAQAARSSSGPDVIYGIPNDNVATFATANLVKDVPSDIISENDYTPASVKACKMNGKLSSVPIAIESIALFYNTDKVKNAPTTFDSLISDAKNNGFMFDISNFYYAYGFMRANGGYVFKDNNGQYDIKDIGLENDGAKKGYSFLNDFVNKYHFMPADITGDVAKSNFQSGKIAYYIGGPWDVESFKSAKTHFKIAPLPTWNGNHLKTAVGTQVAFVNASTKNESLAWDFIKYMGDECALPLYKVGSRIPAKLAMQQKPEIKNDPNTEAFIEQASYGEPMPTIPEISQVWAPAQNNLKLVFTNKINVDKAASNIVAQLKQGITTMDAGK